MGEIKSAYEIAMEKAERLGKASPEELTRWKYVPEGERLAGRYLRDECTLIAELGEFDDSVRGYVVEGATEVFLGNIELPKNDFAKAKNRKALEAIKSLKDDKASIENVYSKIRRIFSHYEQDGEGQRRQAYEGLKGELQLKFQQAAQQQGLPAGTRINVESQPQFHEEWRRILTQLDSQYYKLLDEYKQEIVAIA